MNDSKVADSRGSDDAELAGHLRWMAQKMELGAAPVLVRQ